jgi:peptidyl-prolyl cis-trans isomerase D
MPSTEDTARALGSLNQLKAEFASSADAESFVNRNSEEPFNPAFVNKASFMSMYADSIMNTGTGSVYGPYFENGAYKMTKVLEKRSMPDSVKVRHILVKTEDANQPMLSDSAAKLKLDSAIAAINTGAPFATVVERYSDDPGSKQTAGEYTFTLQQKSQLSKEFADFAFEGNAGEKKTVKVDNDAYAGYHYIEIMEQKGVQPAIKIATVSKALYPGDATENAAYAKATEFAGRNGNAKAFDEAVKTQNLNKKNGDNVKANDFMIAGFGSAREVIRWMYDAEVGDVSQVFALDNRYVIAKLSGKQDKGLMKLDAAMRPSIEAAVRAEKKAEILKNKYKSSASVDAVAQATGQPVQQADSFNLASPFAPNLGYEPKAVGYCFYEGFKPNTLSPAITGQDGVIFMSVIMRGTKPMPSDPIIINQQKSMLDMQSKNTMASVMQEVLRKNAEIEYNTQNL